MAALAHYERRRLTFPRHVAVAIVTATALLIARSAGAEIVRVEFTGVMDFSSIGGSAAQPYSGIYTYDTAIPPFDSECIPNTCYAHYQLTLVGHQMFGTSLTPTLVSSTW